MIYPVTYYTAKCDNCGSEWADGSHEFTAMGEDSDMAETLMNDDWKAGDQNSNEGKDGEHYCPDCWSYDENDVFHLREIEKP